MVYYAFIFFRSSIGLGSFGQGLFGFFLLTCSVYILVTCVKMSRLRRGWKSQLKALPGLLVVMVPFMAFEIMVFVYPVLGLLVCVWNTRQLSTSVATTS